MDARESLTVMEGDVKTHKNKLKKPPNLQELKAQMTAGNIYATMFPNVFQLLHIPLTLPIGIAIVEHSVR